MSAIEEIINIPKLIEMLKESTDQGHLGAILEEIIKQSKIEFNYATNSEE